MITRIFKTAKFSKDANGKVLGAVGASGGTGDEDEAICIAGITAAGLIAA